MGQPITALARATGARPVCSVSIQCLTRWRPEPLGLPGTTVIHLIYNVQHLAHSGPGLWLPGTTIIHLIYNVQHLAHLGPGLWLELLCAPIIPLFSNSASAARAVGAGCCGAQRLG